MKLWGYTPAIGDKPFWATIERDNGRWSIYHWIVEVTPEELVAACGQRYPTSAAVQRASGISLADVLPAVCSECSAGLGSGFLI